MPSDLNDVDLTEKLLSSKKKEKSTRAVSLSSDEESSVGSAADIVWISEPCKGFSMKNRRDSVAKKTRSLGSCLCKCALITTLVLTALAALTFGFAYVWVKDVVQHLTVHEHRSFPVVDMTDAQVDVIKDRVKLFVDELRKGDSSMPLEDLVITQDEINGLLGHSDYLRGNMYVTLEKDNILEEYSLPMDMMPGGKGRYFDGHDYTKLTKAGHLEMKMETKALHKDWFVGPLYFLQLSYNVNDSNQYHQHLLELFLENGSTIFGNPIPEDVIHDHHNLLEDAYADPDSGFDVRAVVDGIQGIQLLEQKIVIMPRRRHQDNAVEDDEMEEDMYIAPAKPYRIEEGDLDEDAENMWAKPALIDEDVDEESEETWEGTASSSIQGEPVAVTTAATTTEQPQEPIAVELEQQEANKSKYLRAQAVPAAAPTKTAATSLRAAKSSP